MNWIWGKRKNHAVDLTPKPRKKTVFFRYLTKMTGITLFVPLTLLALLLAFHYYRENTQLRTSMSVGVMTHSEETSLLQQLSQIVLLPAGETPLIATITNPLLLSGQPFYVHAHTGDKVIVYCIARKTILYDPIAKKIIEFASDVPPKTCPA